MAELRVQCPACDARLKLSDPELVGKAIKCPKCKERFVVPVEEDDEPTVEDTFEAEERPEKVKPRKKKKAKGKKASSLPYLIGGAVFLVAIVVILIVALGGSDNKKNANLAKGKEITRETNTDVGKHSGQKKGKVITSDTETDVGRNSGRENGKETNGDTADETKRTSSAAPPQFTYDVAKLGYDPNKPDQTIAAHEWPRRRSARDQWLSAYEGKVLAVVGRIHAIWGGDHNSIGKASIFLFDADGPRVDYASRTVPITVFLSDQVDWQRLRPGQIVKVAGQVRTPPAGEPQMFNSVILTVSGEGDKPMSPKDLVEAYALEPKKYKAGWVTDLYVTLVGTVYRVPNVKPGLDPLLLVGEPGSLVVVQINNAKDFAANPPKAGDTVTIVARITETDYLYDLGKEPKPKALGMAGLLITNQQ